jgi:prevent-host-death family protein
MTSKIISAAEARKRFGEIMNRVALGGESLTIARAGKLLVRIVPVTPINEDVFDRPFKTFTEWHTKSNDAYDTLQEGYKAMALDAKYNDEASEWTEESLDAVE